MTLRRLGVGGAAMLAVLLGTVGGTARAAESSHDRALVRQLVSLAQETERDSNQLAQTSGKPWLVGKLGKCQDLRARIEWRRPLVQEVLTSAFTIDLVARNLRRLVVRYVRAVSAMRPHDRVFMRWIVEFRRSGGRVLALYVPLAPRPADYCGLARMLLGDRKPSETEILRVLGIDVRAYRRAEAASPPRLAPGVIRDFERYLLRAGVSPRLAKAIAGNPT